MAQDYWWVTRPKRKLNPIPEILAIFSSVALGKKWTGNRLVHIAFEDELERAGIKRVGERRDRAGSGGRTYGTMLYSLGLWFEHHDIVYLTLAGEAIMDGKSPIEVLKKQVLYYQYPSAYATSAKISERLRLRPYLFILKLLMDNRLAGYLHQEEIAWILAPQAESESEKCYERMVDEIRRYRSSGQEMLTDEYFARYGTSRNNLNDVANTMMNWLDYTRLIYRDNKIITVAPERHQEVAELLLEIRPMIKYNGEADLFQRKYGVDPWHEKDTRNLLNTPDISAKAIDSGRIKKCFFEYSAIAPVAEITASIVNYIAEKAGTDYDLTERVLQKQYPHGAMGGYLANYRSLAFGGKKTAIDFEKATTRIFQDIFGYKAIHMGQGGSLSVPDILLVSESDGYQAIIDNKAYSHQYSISSDHKNRMVHNYIEGIGNYNDCHLPIGFFSYISSSFGSNINKQIKEIATASNVHGSGITVDTFISMIEKHQENAYDHGKLRSIFIPDRQIYLADL